MWQRSAAPSLADLLESPIPGRCCHLHLRRARHGGRCSRWVVGPWWESVGRATRGGGGGGLGRSSVDERPEGHGRPSGIHHPRDRGGVSTRHGTYRAALNVLVEATQMRVSEADDALNHVNRNTGLATAKRARRMMADAGGKGTQGDAELGVAL